MGLTDGLGRLARDWARSKATELLTADPGKRADAALAADATARTARDDVGARLVRSALPGLGEIAARQEERRRVAAAEQADAEQAEVAALPRARVALTLTGTVACTYAGELPLRWELESGDADGDSALSVELVPPAGARPALGPHALTRLAFVVPGYVGDGTYDLAALYRSRTAAGADDLPDWGVELDDGDHCFWFSADAGPSTVTVTDGGHHLVVTLALSGAAGPASVSATLSR